MKARAILGNLAWLTASAAAHRRFVCGLRDPQATQELWLRAHLARNAATSYGRHHSGGNIRSYADFARAIPVVNYDDLTPWIARIRRGDSGVLTQEPVTRLVPTSGSTGGRKLIPFTSALQRNFNAAIGPWMVDLFRQKPAIAMGRAYWSVTPLDGPSEVEASAVPIGFDDDAEYLGGARAWLIAGAMAVPSDVRHLNDRTVFRRTVLLHLLRSADLRLISIWHPSFLTLLFDALARDWDTLLDALRQSGDSRRTRKLQEADPNRPATIWPALRVVSCWGDAHAAAGLEALRRRLPGVTIQPKGLLATEAFVTVPFSGEYPVAITSHFFEFADAKGNIVPVGGVRVGETYEVIVTTGGGLWRYRLGDTVEVTGFVDRTPSLRFRGRSGIVSDRCGEKLSEPFVAQVLSRMAPSAEFTLLAPEADGASWRYTLFIQDPDEKGPDIDKLDIELSVNPHYALCRRLGQLGSPAIQRIREGGYERFVTAEVRRGLRLGDIKPVALSSRTGWREQLDERGGTEMGRPHDVIEVSTRTTNS